MSIVILHFFYKKALKKHGFFKREVQKMRKIEGFTKKFLKNAIVVFSEFRRPSGRSGGVIGRWRIGLPPVFSSCRARMRARAHLL